MRLKLRYFGAVAEKTMKKEETMDFKEVLSAAELKSLLEKKYELQDLQFSLAINKEISSVEHLYDNDEVALLPPFAGG